MPVTIAAVTFKVCNSATTPRSIMPESAKKREKNGETEMNEANH
jgi:hypothetical protein